MLQITTSTSGLIQLGLLIALAVLTLVLAWGTRKYSHHNQYLTEEIQKSRELLSEQTAAMRESSEVTEKQVEQLRKSRETEFQPDLVASASSNRLESLYFLVIENIGRGPAKNLTAEWSFTDIDDSERKWGKPVFHTGEKHRFGFPLHGQSDVGTSIESIKEALNESEGILTVSISCEDALDNEYQFNYDIDVIGQLEARNSAGELVIDSEDEMP